MTMTIENRGQMKPVSLAVMSVRELIAELAEVEADLRRWRHPVAAKSPEPAVEDLVHHEKVIVDELRRRARVQQLASRTDPGPNLR